MPETFLSWGMVVLATRAPPPIPPLSFDFIWIMSKTFLPWGRVVQK